MASCWYDLPAPRARLARTPPLTPDPPPPSPQVMFHGDATNTLTYSLERKRLALRLSVAHFGTNLEYVRGTPPPRRTHASRKFNLITRAWVPSAQQPTLGAVRDHFIQLMQS